MRHGIVFMEDSVSMSFMENGVTTRAGKGLQELCSLLLEVSYLCNSTKTGYCTSILRFDGDDAFSLWPKALGGLGLHFELVWDILTQVGHSQGSFRIVSFDIDIPGLP